MRGGCLEFVSVAALLGALAALGCGTANDPRRAPEPARCTRPSPSKAAPLDAVLEIGSGGPGNFRAHEDGDTTEIVIGSQGGYMAIPVFRVDAVAMGSDGQCAYLDVRAAVSSLAPLDYSVRLPDASPADPYWYFGTLPLFLSYELDAVVGKTVTYSATFTDDGMSASDEVTLLLVDDD
jgi:hypothetical protein